MRRGRHDDDRLRVGDSLDFWRVEAYEPPRLLRLHAEMKLPGSVWLEFEVTPSERGSTIRQTAIFDLLGLWGLAYWYASYPLHQSIFAGLLRKLARARNPESEAAYPQVFNQKPGLGVPIARIGAITSLACGVMLNLGFCRYAGKGQGEVSLLRQLWNVLHPGDVLLADSLLSNWTRIILLQDRGVDLVSRLNKAHRKPTFAAERAWATTTTSFAGVSRRPFAQSIGQPTNRCRST